MQFALAARGMQGVDGACPECGGLVADSREKSITRWGAKYLRRLGRSAAWMAWTAAAFAMIYLLGDLLRAWAIRARNDFDLGEGIRRGMWVALVADVSVHVAAVWIGTAAPPGGRVGKRGVMSRIGATMFLLSMIDATFLTFGARLMMRSGATPYLIGAISVLMLGVAVHAVQTGRRLEAHCIDGGRRSLGRWAKWVGMDPGFGHRAECHAITGGAGRAIQHGRCGRTVPRKVFDVLEHSRGWRDNAEFHFSDWARWRCCCVFQYGSRNWQGRSRTKRRLGLEAFRSKD